MSILSDRQIRKRVKIVPFTEAKKRPGKISYGVSSYGYDARVGSLFKIFTPVSASGKQEIVDPKNFTDALFVTVDTEKLGQDHIVIPPNSFALAETVEIFNIPRDILCVCVGKSTYARCFTGDTTVALADGTNPTFLELIKRHDNGETLWGYGIDQCGRIVVSVLDKPRLVDHESVIEVILDTGESIRCTPDHEFITRDGRWVTARHLRDGESLMPLYRSVRNGYEGVFQPLTATFTSTHWLADEWNVSHEIYAPINGCHRHHVDHNRRNNFPTNIIRVLAEDHIKYHNCKFYGEEFDSVFHGILTSDAMRELAAGPEWSAKYSQAQRAKARRLWDSPEYSSQRQSIINNANAISDSQRRQFSEASVHRLNDPEYKQAHQDGCIAAWARDTGTRRELSTQLASTINKRDEITEESVIAALTEAGSIRGAAKILDCDRSVFRRFKSVVSQWHQEAELVNHKVVTTRAIPGTHDVYCLTSPETGNFALGTGIFVSNCGIIVNVTPLEPEWRGKVTIEISNTTPLPAKIYAGEGIAQFLFYEAADICEISYADKSGKYQDQEGLVLPKVD